MLTRFVLCVALFAPLLAFARDEFDYGVSHVHVEDHWPSVDLPWMTKNPPAPGIGITSTRTTYAAITYLRGWVAEDDAGVGVAGLLDKAFGADSHVEAKRFGRVDNQIYLVLAVRPTGELRNWVKMHVRDERKAAKDAPVSTNDVDQVLGKKRVAFSASFPEDLPEGEYKVIVELVNEASNVLERYTHRFIQRDPKKTLASFDDAALLKEYVKRGEALRGTGVEPADVRYGLVQAAYAYERPGRINFDQTHAEIVRRGAKMVPALLKLLETEAVRNADPENFGFAVNIMMMLGEIGDASAVPALVGVIGNARANVSVRMEALNTVQKITYVAFVIASDNPAVPDAMTHPDALVKSRQVAWRTDGVTLTAVAKLYENWLKGEGADASQWLPLARQRAWAALEGNDVLAIRSALSFLPGRFYSAGHDDQPEKTLARIARLMGRPEILSGLTDWISMPGVFSAYGPAARPYVALILKHAPPETRPFFYQSLADIGGEEATAYLVRSLPALREQVRAAGLSLDVAIEDVHDKKSREVLLAYRVCRLGIERSAGRTFATDEDIAAWWEGAKNKPQRAWLDENLDRTAAEADAGDAKAQSILRGVLPDLPFPEDDRHFDPPLLHSEGVTYREKTHGAFRLPWLKANRERLQYDEGKSCFVLKPSKS